MPFPYKLSILSLLMFALVSCSDLHKNDNNNYSSIKFEDFQKVLSPRSSLFPIPGKDKSLLLMRMPGDEYAKLYSLQHKSKKFTLLYDASKNISDIFRDPTLKNYYLLMDNHGDENYQIYKLTSDYKSVKKVFGKKGFKAIIVGFSMDGKRIYIRSNHLNKKVYSIFVFSTKNQKLSSPLTPKNESFDGAVISKNEKYAALTKAIGNNETHLYILKIKNKKIKKLLAKKATNFDPSFFHPQNPILYIETNDEKDRTGCAKVQFEKSNKIEWLYTSDKKDYSCGYSKVSNYSILAERFEGKRNVRVFNGIYGKEYILPIPKNAVVSQVTCLPGDDYAYTRFVTSNSPGEFYKFNITKGASAKLIPVSSLNLSGLTSKDFASSYDLHYKSFDGLDIHGIIYAKKSWLNEKKKHPVILWPHGGPDGYEMHVFHSFFQYWVLNGYVVFAPNFRGSSGYGKKFETLNDKDWGGGHIADLIWGKRALEKLSYVDKDRVFIVGASFGGFSTLSAITEFPKEFKGAVAIVALANLFTFFKSIPPDPAWQNEFLTEMGHPEKDKILYRERSPYFHAHKISIPLKIYQAENDVRTVKSEMDNFVKKMKSYNLPVEYEVLENEGHSLAKRESWQKVLQGTVEFLDKI
ncbi:MAG: S9 family peptidase [Bacteriovoracaceae bacterium]|nr:S9 family peptidase [Bacteriovoracaceae bacterium]